MSFEDIRPILTGIVGAVCGVALSYALSRWIPKGFSGKSAETLVRENRRGGVGKLGLKTRGAINELSRQLANARAASRIAKLEGRISAHQDRLLDALIMQGAFQLLKKLLDEARGDPKRTERQNLLSSALIGGE